MGLNRNFKEGDYVKVVRMWEPDAENGIPFGTPSQRATRLLLGGAIGRINKKCTSEYCWIEFDCVNGKFIYAPYFALEKVESPNQTGGRTMSDERKWIASDGVTELKPGMLVLVRDTGNCNWNVGLFSYCQFDKYPYLTDKSCFELCIPLEGNEHMAGTTLPIPQEEKPFEWGEKVLVWNKGCTDRHLAIFNRTYGEGDSLRYGAFVKGNSIHDGKEGIFSCCTRAPLDADAEQE